MTPPNTTPLNEEDRLGEQLLLKKILLIDTVNNILGEVDGVPDRNAFVLLGTPAELIRQMSELIQTLEKKAYENGLHDGEQVATFVFIKRLQARKKNTAPNSGAGREIKDLLKELEK